MTIKSRIFNLQDINIYNVWVWSLFFSFAYEMPIFIISSMDKVNPRLFDLVLMSGIFLLFKNKKFYRNRVFTQWIMIISWFTIVVIIGVSVFPYSSDIKSFMFYFLFEYYKGLLAILIFLSIPKKYYSLNTIIYALIAGGLFVASYSVYELFVGISEVIVSGDITQKKSQGMVWGPYIGSYFEISVFVPMAFSIAFVLAIYSKGKNRIIMTCVTLFISWPVLFTGSRTAIFLFIVTLSIIMLISLKKTAWVLLSILAIIAGTVMLTEKFSFFFDLNKNETLQRIQALEGDERENSILNRVLFFTQFNHEDYDQGDTLPLIGAGFYVAPINGKNRVGYGFHNIYLFPYEQAGLVALILFMIFVFVSIKILIMGLKTLDKNSLSYWFVVAVFAYFVASLLIGVSGHSFWRGFTTYNFNTLRILLLVVASMVVIDYRKQEKERISENDIIS